jgi:polar amino acid transport system substrate-binding protein
MEVKAEFVEDSWATLIAGLQANKFDVTIPMGITLKRALAVTYSKPFMQFQEGMMVLKKDAGKFKNWRELDQAGLKITTTLGATPDIFLTKALTAAELVRAKDGATSLNQLLTGRANAWANSYEAFAKVLKDRDDVAVVPGPPMGSVPVAFTLRQGDYHFRDWINYFLDEESKTGSLLRLMKKHGMDETYLVDQASAPAPRN